MIKDMTRGLVSGRGSGGMSGGVFGSVVSARLSAFTSRKSINFPATITTVSLLAVLAGCATNPVTGDRELNLISTHEQIAIGEQNYVPTQQSQGGQYKVDAELTRYVNEVGQRVAAYAPIDLPYEFVVLNNSVPNAWALPGGKMAINRGLLYELETEAELAAVLGHEAVHAAARHGAQSMERGMLLQGALMATTIAASNSDYAGYIVGGAQVGAQLISQQYGRDAERESDLYGTRYMAQAGYDPQAAVSLQETFVRLSEGRQAGWLDGLFASHPPSQERVANNRQLVAQLRSEGFTNGEQGRERYQQMTQTLRETKPAYDAFDEAQRLASEGQLDEAEAQVDEAIRMFSREARFYGLKGNIALNRRDYGEAIDLYNSAIARDDGYYEYYLGRGLAYNERGNDRQARADLQASNDLLPTALASNELGGLALAANDRSAAKSYFEQAASAPGQIGQNAQQAYYRLEIQDNPGSAVQGGVYVDDQGRVILRLRNASPVNLSQVTVQMQGILNGEAVSQPATIQNLAAGQTQDFNTGVQLAADGSQQLTNAQVIVQQAVVAN